MAIRAEQDEIRDQAINIRATRGQRSLIDRAYFRLDAESYARFTSLLDAPMAPTPELRNLLSTKAPWD